MDVIRYFSLCEGILTKDKIMELSNKEIFYRMKNGAFIRETGKKSGVFKATDKLKNLTSKMTDVSYSVGCSAKHSQKLAKAVGYLPKEVLKEGRYASGQSLHKEMQAFKQTRDYQQAVRQLQQKNQKQYDLLQASYRDRLSHASTQAERLQAGIDHKADLAVHEMHRDILYGRNPVFIPDFRTTVSIREAEEILDNLSARAQELDFGKEQALLEQDIAKLQTMINSASQPVIDIYWECMTNSYGNAQLYKHEVYSQIMNRDILYIY